MISHPYLAIQKKLGFNAALPYTAQWSAAADFLNLLIEYCQENKPSTILECSSGLSTLVLARYCQINARGHVFSLENGRTFAEETRENLRHFDLSSQATVIDATLIPYQLKQRRFDWYAMDQLPAHRIDMLVIDGPPGHIQRHSRFPALPLLHQQLNDRCAIFLDDAARDEEKEIVALWLKQFPGLEHTFVDTERGCSILHFSRP